MSEGEGKRSSLQASVARCCIAYASACDALLAYFALRAGVLALLPSGPKHTGVILVIWTLGHAFQLAIGCAVAGVGAGLLFHRTRSAGGLSFMIGLGTAAFPVCGVLTPESRAALLESGTVLTAFLLVFAASVLKLSAIARRGTWEHLAREPEVS